jgi:hypothetical protein
MTRRPSAAAITCAVVVTAGLLIAGCGPTGAVEPANGLASEPATVEHVEGTDLSDVALTAQAAERIGLERVAVADSANGRLQVPYSAVIYDPSGAPWVYTEIAELTFRRHLVAIEDVRAEDNQAVLSAGPPSGTMVVSVGAAELFGTEFEIGH